jgi:hypothetical protein
MGGSNAKKHKLMFYEYNKSKILDRVNIERVNDI